MIAVAAVVAPLAVVQEREQFDNIGPRPSVLGKQHSIQPNARPVRHSMNAMPVKTEILAASIRTVSHVRESLLAGADVGTMPTDIFKKLISHPLTDKGLAAFVADAKKANVTIKG